MPNGYLENQVGKNGKHAPHMAMVTLFKFRLTQGQGSIQEEGSNGHDLTPLPNTKKLKSALQDRFGERLELFP